MALVEIQGQVERITRSDRDTGVTSSYVIMSIPVT